MSVPGMSDERLAQLRQTLTAYVERGDVAGLVALVGRDDQARVDVIGTKAFGDPVPLERDAIFRIASLSKPIVAVAAIALVEDGTVELDAAVDRWLPELADRRVLRSLASPLTDTVAAERAITVEDLLSFRLGYGVALALPGTYPLQRAEAELDLKTMGPPWPLPDLTPDQWIARLATLPLQHQPGQGWRYNTGAQVLGVLVERAACEPLADVLSARVFEPLGMVDTSFHVPASKLSRFTTAYLPDRASGATVELMTTDRLTDDQRPAAAPFLDDHSGWGLGLSVPSSTGATGIPGGYGWDGGTGTTWRSDPATGLTMILFTQRAMSSPEPPDIFLDFFAGAYAARED